jgi:CubicO group peptidase (beta-lactamase class C family)
MTSRKRSLAGIVIVLCMTLLGGSVLEIIRSYRDVSLGSSDEAHSMLSIRNTENFKKQLDQEIPKLQQKYGVPGVAVGIVHEGRAEYALHYGYEDDALGIGVTESTLFQAASMSKSLTAWGILHLAEKGKLSLDDPVDKYITRWRMPHSDINPQDVTILGLLSHTAGLAPHSGYLGVKPGERLLTLEESLSGEGLFNDPVRLNAMPGEQAAYSGGGYTLLQLLIEEVTGQTFADYMEAQILKPLGMTSSTFRQTVADPALSKSYGYFGQELPEYRFTEQAAAGLRTTVTDMMSLILQSLSGSVGAAAGNGIIGEQLLKEMQTPVLSGNGLGVFVRKLHDGSTLIDHSGDNRGYHSYYGFIPESGEGLVILTNSDNGVDLRQDVFHQWIKYNTGSMPDSYSSVNRLRLASSVISLVLATLLGLYLLWFAVCLQRGKRVFISSVMNRRFTVVRLVLRLLVLIALCAGLYYFSYAASLLSLHSGKKTILLLVVLWLGVLMITGFFRKCQCPVPSVKRQESIAAEH